MPADSVRPWAQAAQTRLPPRAGRPVPTRDRPRGGTEQAAILEYRVVEVEPLFIEAKWRFARVVQHEAHVDQGSGLSTRVIAHAFQPAFSTEIMPEFGATSFWTLRAARSVFFLGVMRFMGARFHSRTLTVHRHHRALTRSHLLRVLAGVFAQFG